MKTMDTSKRVPIIHETDYVIVGGGIREIITALELAKQRRRVLLVVLQTYLAHEICSCSRYTFSNWTEYGSTYLEQLFPTSVCAKGIQESGQIVLHPDRFKLHLEALCKQNSIELLYNVTPIETNLWEDKKLVKIAGKFGINGILCSHMIDARRKVDLESLDRYCINVMGMPQLLQNSEQVIVTKQEGYKVLIRQGAYKEDHAIIEIPIKSCKSRASFLCNAKKKALETVLYLREKEGIDSLLIGYFALEGFSSSCTVQELIEEGIGLTKEISQVTRKTNKLENETSCKRTSSLNNLQLVSRNKVCELLSYPQLDVMTHFVEPQSYDLVVVGGGTAGVMAAIHSARQGSKVVLIEMNADLGGTGTVGGVSTYWFGKRFKEVEEVDRAIQAVYERYKLSRNPGIWSQYDDYHPGIRSFVWTLMCIEAGVTLVYPALSYGVIMEKDELRVRGVSVVTEQGIESFLGTYLVDATGDGDLAAFAGAKENYGSKRDYITYWGSLAQYVSPNQYKNNFSSTLIVSDAKDYTRFIQLGRKRGDTMFDHGVYVSPRESRHIAGQYEVTLKDLVSFKTYDDGIYTCFSNYDPKGKLSADMVYAGVLPPQISIQIPLRALLPVKESLEPLEGIVVIGKAISCTHNAFPSIRMQPDLMHQGAVIGFLLAESVKRKINLQEMNATERRIWIKEYTGDDLTLPVCNKDLNRVVQNISLKSRTHWVDLEFTAEVTKHPDSIAIMTAKSKDILPLLQQKYVNAKSQKEKVVLAGYLLWHGDDSKTQVLLDDICRTLRQTEGLPKRHGSTMCVQLQPDHGVMPELVYQLNLLAYSKQNNIVQPFYEILERLKNIERDYMDKEKGIYHYIESFAYVAERSGNEKFLPMLEELTHFEEFKQAFWKENEVALLTERHLILLLSIYRAMARCGGLCGYQQLIELLDVDSLPIVTSVLKELHTLTGQMHLITIEEWKRFVKENSKSLNKQLITEKIW